MDISSITFFYLICQVQLETILIYEHSNALTSLYYIAIIIKFDTLYDFKSNRRVQI